MSVAKKEGNNLYISTKNTFWNITWKYPIKSMKLTCDLAIHFYKLTLKRHSDIIQKEIHTKNIRLLVIDFKM